MLTDEKDTRKFQCCFDVHLCCGLLLSISLTFLYLCNVPKPSLSKKLLLTSFTGGKWAWWLVKSCLINCFLNYFADKSVNKLLFFVFSVCRVAFLNVKACCLCSVLVMNVIYVAWLHLRIPIGKHKFSDCICLFV